MPRLGLCRLLLSVVLLVACLAVAGDVPAATDSRAADLLQQYRQARLAGDRAGALALAGRLADQAGYDLSVQEETSVPAPGFRGGPVAQAPTAKERWQGYDVPVAATYLEEVAADIAGDLGGNLYAAVEYSYQGSGAMIYKSADNGESWSPWFELDNGEDIDAISLTAGVGVENWLLVVYATDLIESVGYSRIEVVRISLADPAIWSAQVLQVNVLGVANPRVVTDADEYSAWYAYIVWNSRVSDHWDLCFSRSTNLGGGWSSPAVVHSYCGAPGLYEGSWGKPDLDYGNQRLHVVYDDFPAGCGGPKRDIYHMYSSNDGGSWSFATTLASASDDEFEPSIAAVRGSLEAGTVVVAYTRIDQAVATWDVDYAYSLDRGDSWTTDQWLSAYYNVDEGGPALAVSRTQGMIHAAFHVQSNVFYASVPWDAPEALSFAGAPVNFLNEVSPEYYRPAIAVNSILPAAGEAAIIWTDTRNFDSNSYDVYFDAPATVGLGGVTVDVEPQGLGIAWHLTGPEGTDIWGSEDASFPDMPEGLYSLTWQPLAGWFPAGPNPVTGLMTEDQPLTFSTTYHRILPGLTSLADVPNDQGRQLRLIWDRAAYDAPDDGVDITGYSIFRRQDTRGRAIAGAGAASSAQLRDGDRVAGWDWITWIPAYGDEVYQVVAPTLCDSTVADGICWSAFFIRASTPDPFTYFDSPPDSGYSVDNLAPAPPGNLRLFAPSSLVWDEISDADFDYYTVIASEHDDLQDPVVLGHTSDTQLDVAGSEGLFLAVAATDFAGNQGEFSTTFYNGTGVGEGAVPSSYRLEQNRPNPFNPCTELRFALPETAAVSLRVYDLGGRLVATLIDGETRAAGHYTVVWNSADREGQALPSGIYLARMESGSFVQLIKMTLLK